jgi:hypothetical protein
MRGSFEWMVVLGGVLVGSAVWADTPPTLTTPFPAPTLNSSIMPGIILPETSEPFPLPGSAPPWYAPAKRKVYEGQSPFVNSVVGKVNRHRCEPDGCPTPLGCGNLWTEFKFAFGSCSQFFGTGEATRGVLHKTRVPPPNSLYLPENR